MRAGLLLALAACGGQEPGGGKAGPPVAPPVPCPTGEVELTAREAQRDLDLLDAWNDVRTSGGICSGTPMDPVNALKADDGLMWAARCWAWDVSVNGPTGSDTFSDGTPVDDVVRDMGFAGFVNGWGVQGDHPSPEAALQAWIDAGGATCEKLWGDGTWGGTGVSEAGGTLVVVRLSAFSPG